MSALSKAENAVGLAGPGRVATEAKSVTRGYGFILRSTLVRLGFEPARRRDPPSFTPAHWPSLTHFRELARSALDDPDGALEHQ